MRVVAQVKNVPKHPRYACGRMWFKVTAKHCWVRFYNGIHQLKLFQIKDGWNKVAINLIRNESTVSLDSNLIKVKIYVNALYIVF